MPCWIAALVFAGLMAAQPVPPPPVPLEDLCAREHERIARLFNELDLERPALESVRARVEAEDYAAACRALLGYYEHRFSGIPVPEASENTAPGADAIVDSVFTFYGVEAEVPGREGGGLDWSHRGPTDDREWAWGLNRHSHLSGLLRAYQDTGNPVYARTIDWHLRDWVLSSPYPGEKSQTARWRGLEAALRIDDWVAVFTTLQGNPLLSPDTRILMLSSLPEHAHYLRHFHAGGGNWVTMEMNGLAEIGLTWPEFRKSKDWVAYAVERMTPELEAQVYPDGVQMELTSHYHRVAAYNFEEFADRLEAHGYDVPARYRETLERMWNYLAYSMRPNGYGVQNNDSDYDHTRPKVRALAREYGRSDWTWIATNGTEGAPPEGGPSLVFPWAGQALLRNGWAQDANWAFFDAGPLGTGHVHYDKLHLSVSVAGRDVLVDSGRYSYVGGPWRAYFTQSPSHNVLLIDGGGQKHFPNKARKALPGRDTVPGGAERLERLGGLNATGGGESGFLLTPEYDYVRGVFHEGYRDVDGQVTHTRAVFHRPDRYWLVLDRVETGRPRELTALWHFHPECTVERAGASVLTTDAEKGNLRVAPFGLEGWNLELVRGQTEPEIQGWYSLKYNSKTPSTAAVYRAPIAETATFGWLLLPAAGTPPEAAASILEDGPGAVVVDVSLPDGETERWRVPIAGDTFAAERL